MFDNIFFNKDYEFQKELYVFDQSYCKIDEWIQMTKMNLVLKKLTKMDIMLKEIYLHI